jgi:Flp pilus assembly protein TadG
MAPYAHPDWVGPMIKFFRKLWRDRRGNALVIAGAALPLIIGSAGLASDTIQWVLWKRQLQRAADSAAIAGVYATMQSQTVSSAVSTDLTKNQSTGIALQSGYPQITYPTITNAANAVKVALAVQRPLGFSGVFMSSAPIIKAEATAATVTTGVYCVVSLENTSATGITATGNSDIDLGCGMITNSTSLNAAIATGSSSVTATPIAAVGDIQDSTHWNDAELLPFTIAEQDPYGSVDAPTNFPSGSCPSYTAGANATAPALVAGTDYAATPDGYYCMSDMRLMGTVTLPNGVYVIDGGDFTVGSQANVTCVHCTFILTNHNSGTSGIQIGNVNINGGAQLNLGASTSGNYDNILFYQDRRAQSGTSQTNQINGNSSSTMSGAFYFPTRTLDINGTSNLSFSCAQFVARTVNFSGNGSITNTCTGGYGDDTITGNHVRLVA